MTPYFSLVLTERSPFFSLFSLLPKDPYFGGRVRIYPSLPYVSAPPPPPRMFTMQSLFRLDILFEHVQVILSMLNNTTQLNSLNLQ